MACGSAYMGASDAVNIDTAAVPDPDLMVACLGEGFAEITEVAAAVPVNARPAS